ncbi:MAG: putative lipid II flippase FtsW [Nocardioides sp.]|nr:putative lipid II flippase FtsW [Nocardioides sp.]
MTAIRESAQPSLGGWFASTRRSLNRPLAPYYLLLGASALLLTIGLMMVLSSSSVWSFRTTGSSYTVFLRQLTWVGIGLPCAFLASRLPRRVLRALAWPALVVSLVLLALVMTPLGHEVNGNKNWLGAGPVRLQPSEITKLAMVLWAADLYARKEHLLGDWRHAVVPVVPVLALATGLVVLQGDLGTALVLCAIVLGMLWVVGAPGQLFAVTVGLAGTAGLYLAATNEVRRSRMLNFADPFKDFEGTGWQSAHGLFAMSSGGILGKGISASQQKWGSLPEAHTDFIFAVLGEELGLVGTLLVLSLFGVIAYAGVRLALQTEDPFVRFMTAGVVVWLMSQMMINIGMVLALLPVIGIPLPLVSYGGSSLLPTLVALGVLIGFARSEPGAAAALRSRRGRRGRTARGVTAVARRGS